MSTWDSLSSEDREASGKSYNSAPSQRIDTRANYEVSPLQTTNTVAPSYNQGADETMSNPEHLGPRMRISALRPAVNENPAPLYHMGTQMAPRNAAKGDNDEDD